MANPSSNKGWHGEFVKVKSGDLPYLPEYKRPDGVMGAIRRFEKLSIDEHSWAVTFVGGKKEGLWQEKEFWSPQF